MQSLQPWQGWGEAGCWFSTVFGEKRELWKMKKCKISIELLLCPSSSTINIQQHQESWFRTVECGGGVCRQLMRICQMPAASKFHKTTTTQSPFPVWPGSDFLFWRPGKGFHIKSIVATTSSHQQSPWIFWYSNLEGVAFLSRSLFWSWFRFHSSHDHKKGKVWRNTRKRAGAPNSCQDQLQLSSWWWWWRWWWWLSGRLEPLSGPIKTLSRVIVVVVVVMLNFNSNASIYNV